MTISRSDWDRWGDKDELGTLNLLTPELVQASIRLVAEGKAYGLVGAVGSWAPIGARNRTHHHMTGVVDSWHYGDQRLADEVFADDAKITHCHSSTHLDALSHHLN